jgi:Tfp pilus assembly protein PilE
MITQELLDFIKNQQINGNPEDVITATLINNGWKLEDIQEGLIEAAKITPKPALVADPAIDQQKSTQFTVEPTVQPKQPTAQSVNAQSATTQPVAAPFSNITAAQQEWMIKQGGVTDPTAYMNNTQPMPSEILPVVQAVHPQITYEQPKRNGGGKTCLIVGLVVGGLGCLTLIVLGILSAGVLVAINPAAQIEKARVMQNRNNFLEIQNALTRYYATKNTYPATLDELVSEGQITKIPVDPETQESYVYTLSAGSLDYELCTSSGATTRTCLTKDSVPGEIFTIPTPNK